MKRRPIFVTSILAVLLLVNVFPVWQPTVKAAPPLTIDSNDNVVPASAAQAATQLSYSDAATINLNLNNLQVEDATGTPFNYNQFSNAVFTDGKVFDNNHEYDNNDGCHQSTIKVDGFGYQTAKLDLWTPDPGNGNACTEIKYTDTVQRPDLGKTIFEWTSATTIAMNPQQDNINFVLIQTVAKKNVFQAIGVHHIGLLGDPCSGFDLTSCDDISSAILTTTDDNHGTVQITDQGSSSSGQDGPKSFDVLIAGSPTNPIAGGPTTSGSTSSGTTTQLTCHAGINPLDWLICPLIKGMVSILSGVDSIINDLLEIGTPSNTSSGDPSQIFDTNTTTGADYYKAWSSFRDIALGLMVVVGLIMVIAQALGMEILDAYAIRRILPRLIMVAIGITLSWPILRFVVQLFNDLGYGTRYLIESPFHGLKDSINLSGGTGTAAGLATALGVTALGIFGLLTFVGTALLATFIAFLVLIIRQVVVVALVIAAPIALVCYILPNTQKVWKIWLDSFGGALVMFPLITGMIASGRVFSAVANVNAGNSTFDTFIAFAAYFAPYFLIPATFKFAGGALRTIGGMAGDRSKGGFARLSKARGDHVGRRMKAARRGHLWNDNFGKFDYSNTKAGSLYRGFHKKVFNRDRELTGHVGAIGNRIAINAFDQDELLIYKAGKPRQLFGRGKVRKGVPLLRRGSAKIDFDQAKKIRDQTLEGAKELGAVHYKALGIVGLDHEHASIGVQKGMADKRLKGRFGEIEYEENEDGSLREDQEGNLIPKIMTNSLGHQSLVWKSKAFEGTLDDVDTLSTILGNSTDEKERVAGKELYDHRGLIANFREDEDHEYADLNSAAAFMAGTKGRAEATQEAANYAEGRMGNPAATLLNRATEDANSQKRGESRHGYGTVLNPDTGKREDSLSVAYGTRVERGDGSIEYVHYQDDGTAIPHEVYAAANADYVTRARKVVKTMIDSESVQETAHQKGESQQRKNPHFYHALAQGPQGDIGPNGQRMWSNEQQPLIQEVQQQLSTWGGDPGHNKAAFELLDDLSHLATPITAAELGITDPRTGRPRDLSDAEKNELNNQPQQPPEAGGGDPPST
jgi:hypothetical protein